jgi:hypothetical protein
MKQAKGWNDVSKELIASLGLKDDTVVTIRLYGMRVEGGIMQVPTVLAIPTQDRIYDKFKKDYVSIANIAEVNPDNSISFRSIQLTANEAGMRTYQCKNPSEREELEYLLLSNFNGDKEGRDDTKTIYFTVYNPGAEKKSAMKGKFDLADAIVKVRDMTVGEVKAYAASRGWDLKQNVETLRADVMNIAERSPRLFLSSIDPEALHINAVVRKAEVDGLITFSVPANGWEWTANGDMIKSFPRSPEFDRYLAFNEWMIEDDNAHPVFETLEKSVGMARTKKATPKAAPAATNKEAAKDE